MVVGNHTHAALRRSHGVPAAQGVGQRARSARGLVPMGLRGVRPARSHSALCRADVNWDAFRPAATDFSPLQHRQATAGSTAGAAAVVRQVCTSDPWQWRAACVRLWGSAGRQAG